MSSLMTQDGDLPLQQIIGASNAQKLNSLLRDPAVRRTLPMILLGTVIVAGFLMYNMFRQPAYTVVLANLSAEDKGAVVQALQSGQIKSRINPSTGQVEVPVEDYHTARIALASAGLPKNTVTGLDGLKDMPVGTSRSVEEARLRQALETELARSILEIKGVEAARVHLATPEKSVFLRDQTEPSASVTVRLNDGNELSEGQVKSIIHLVSSSISGLKANKVTVVDQWGKLLSEPDDGSVIGMSTKQLSYQKKVESKFRDRILSLLTPVVGRGNITAEINVDLDFTQTEETRTVYNNKEGAIRSEQSSVDEAVNSPASGVPGGLANQPPAAAALATAPGTAGEGAGMRNKSSNEVRNYEPGRSVSTRRNPVGNINRINAAVVIRDKEVLDPETGEMTVQKMTETERERLTALVKEAIGFDIDRGDSVVVTNTTFKETVNLHERQWWEATWVSRLTEQFTALIILAVIIFGALRPFLNRLLQQQDMDDAAAAAEMMGLDSGEIVVRDGESLDDIKARLKPKKQAISAEMLDTANTYDDKVALIRMLVGEDIGRVTNVLKSMMKSEITH